MKDGTKVPYEGHSPALYSGGVREWGAPTKEAGGTAPLYLLPVSFPSQKETNMPYWRRRARRCEDCGRSFPMEHLNQVEWIHIAPLYRMTTWLQLCTRCSRVMARAFDGSPEDQLTFHPF